MKKNELLEKNLTELRNTNKLLFDILVNAKEKLYEGIQTKDGELFYCKNAQTIKLSGNKIKNKENLKNKNCVSVVIGACDYALIEEIIRLKEEKHYIIVIEENVYFLRYLLAKIDLSGIIKNKEIYFLTNLTDFSTIIYWLDYKNGIENWYIYLSENLEMIEEYAKIASKVYEIMNQFLCSVNTITAAGKEIAKNDILSLPYIIPFRGVNEIKSFFKNKPAIIVSTGTSLEKNIWRLKQYKDNVVIIAVAQALRILLAYDIKPDFIVTVDYGIVNEDHFKYLWDIDVPLVCLNKTYWEILRKWQGTKIIVNSADNKNSFNEILYKKGMIEQGGSVSHTAFGLAVHLECNPITLIGQDLSYENLSYSHSSNADASGEIYIKDGLLYWRIKSGHLKDKIACLGEPVYVEGYFGEAVITNTGLLSFLTTFENLFEKYHKFFKIYNSTEGGANIKYAEKISLKSFLEKFGKRKIDKTKLLKLLNTKFDYKEDLNKVKEILKNDLNEFKNVRKNAIKAIYYNKKIKEWKDKDEEKFKFYLEKNKKCTSEVEKFVKTSSLLSAYLYKENRKVLSNELNAKGDYESLKEETNLKKRLKRNKFILNEVLKSLSEIRKMYNQTLERFDYIGFEKTEKDKLLTDEELIKFLEDKNFAMPYSYIKYFLKDENYFLLKKCIEMREENIKKYRLIDNTKKIEMINLIQKAQEFGKNKNFKSALKFLLKAYNFNKDNETVIWGLASTYFLLKQFKRSEKLYKKLIEKYPQKKQYKFELANVYLSNNKTLRNGLNIIEEIFEETKEFDYFKKFISKLQYKNGNKEKALKMLEDYAQIFKDDSEIEELTKLYKGGIE